MFQTLPKLLSSFFLALSLAALAGAPRAWPQEADGATAQIKGDPDTRDIPVVLLTAHTYGSVGRRAREVGCSGYISKPCEPRRVLEEVQKLTN